MQGIFSSRQRLPTWPTPLPISVERSMLPSPVTTKSAALRRRSSPPSAQANRTPAASPPPEMPLNQSPAHLRRRARLTREVAPWLPPDDLRHRPRQRSASAKSCSAGPSVARKHDSPPARTQQAILHVGCQHRRQTIGGVSGRGFAPVGLSPSTARWTRRCGRGTPIPGPAPGRIPPSFVALPPMPIRQRLAPLLRPPAPPPRGPACRAGRDGTALAAASPARSQPRTQ